MNWFTRIKVENTPQEKDYDPEHDELARPFPNETTDLNVHVDVCARRFKGLRGDVHNLRRDTAVTLQQITDKVTTLQYLTIGVLVLASLVDLQSLAITVLSLI